MSTQRQEGQRDPKSKRIVDSSNTVALDKETTEKILSKYDEEEDCFSKEWDPKASECSMCSAEGVCGVLFSARTKKKVKKYEDKETTTPLDLTDFSKVPSEKLVTMAKQFEESGEYMEVQELFDFVSQVSKCDDQEAIISWIKNWVSSNDSIYTSEGFLRYKV